MRTLTSTLLILALVATVGGFFPCLGWINWAGVPLCLVVMVLGIVGLMSDREGADQPGGSHQGTYLAALVLGLLMGVLGAVRCLMGGGIV
ncbi:MAG: hypothetical protein QF724_00155 [Planctomycetota bacterium]|jgi:hypothetical protein|nr:hypothetical protein [Planctomycetota bacterium]MDP6837330.1 hypothetical protein [Planctomycetota bacterium]